MKQIIKLTGILLIITSIFSCSKPELEQEPGLIGLYEFVDTVDGKIYEAQITLGSISAHLRVPGIGTQPIVLISDVEFEVLPFEKWNYINTVKGELRNDELLVTQEVFELDDLVNPIVISYRVYIRK